MSCRSLLNRLLLTIMLSGLIVTTIACEQTPPTADPVTTTSQSPTITTTQPETTLPTTTIPKTTTQPTSTTTAPTTTKAANPKPVKLEIRRADIQDELALNMFVKPVDEDGDIVAVEGALNIRVWEMLDAFDITLKGELLQSWDGLQIIMDDYETDYGEALVRITYEDFLPEWWQYGVVDVELVYDGGRIEGSDELLLGKIPGC